MLKASLVIFVRPARGNIYTNVLFYYIDNGNLNFKRGGGVERKKGLKINNFGKIAEFLSKFVKSASQQTRYYRFPLSGKIKFIQVKCMHSGSMPKDSGGFCTLHKSKARNMNF